MGLASKFIIIFILIANSLSAQTNLIVEKRIDSAFSKYGLKTSGVAVAVVKDGQIIFKKGYGMANLEYDIPNTPKTIFHIASVSKQFTAFAVYLLENISQSFPFMENRSPSGICCPIQVELRTNGL
jgi:CubicO group peptidase (beta-lactamase class C family)